MISNRKLCFWFIYKGDHYESFLRILLTAAFIGFLHAFFLVATSRQERNWMSKQCPKWKSKRERELCQITELFTSKSIYTNSVVFSLHTWLFYPIDSPITFQISKFYLLVFSWRWVFYLILHTIHPILTIFFLSEFSFESSTILFVALFIYHSATVFQC